VKWPRLSGGATSIATSFVSTAEARVARGVEVGARGLTVRADRRSTRSYH
jgi:hypothetical protein